MSDPRLVRSLWFIVLGALLVAFSLTWGALLEMNRTYPPAIKVPERHGFIGLDPDTGRPVQ